jgi:hypothetical protein
MRNFGWLILLFFACQKPDWKPNRAFLYWKTEFRLSGLERSVLDSTHCKRLYVKFADIGRDPSSGQIVPYALLRVHDGTDLRRREVVPCFFITNQTFQRTEKTELEWLADRVLEALHSVGEQWPSPTPSWPEVLIDCDWSASTRVAFFDFLQILRDKLDPKIALSATIRLHQYANPEKTGIPPVERGLLMLYNTGDIDDIATRNSIYDPLDVAPYLKKENNYPLPLDIALPIYSWGLVYRDGALWKIIPEMTIDNPKLFVDNNRISVLAPTFVGGHLLAPGDSIRIERITPELLQKARFLAQKYIPLRPDGFEGLYHLDSLVLTNWKIDDL